MIKSLAIAIVLGMILATLIAAAAIVAAPESAAFGQLDVEEQIDWVLENGGME